MPGELRGLLVANGIFLMYDVISSKLYVISNSDAYTMLETLFDICLENFKSKDQILFLVNSFLPLVGVTLTVVVVSRAEYNLY